MNTTKHTPAMTPAEINVIRFYRAYEQAHKVWMNTSVFTDAGKAAKHALDCARDFYVLAQQICHPDWIII